MGDGIDKSQIAAVLQVLKKYNLKGTEESLRKEANISNNIEDSQLQQNSDVSSVLTGYKSDGDPETYEESYMELKKKSNQFNETIPALREDLKKLALVTKRDQMNRNELADRY